ncbi:C40 family peptidase [Streptomyces sp. NPDC059080]|uniref:C40 family peptidase n=1 Tax=Streptomyces sp. NPDC059080 TaxID=3346718 RepID=UPI0036BD68A5
MSPNALIPSHRKPRRSASSRALRAGVTGGFLTLAVAGATVPANAADKPVAETQELPTITTALTADLAESADATQQVAESYERQAAQDKALSSAAKAAKKDKAKAEAEQKAAEAKKKAAEAKKKAAEAEQVRASRSADRTSLTGGDSSGSGSDASTPSTGATGSTATLLSFLRAQVGKAYISGSTGPSAYDCSGLTQTAFRQIGIELPRVSQSQSTAGTQVGLGNLQVGDILYWGSAGSAYHVGVYVGNGNFIGAQNSSTGVVERPLSYDQPTGAVRVL